MRRINSVSLLLGLCLLVSGCKSLDPTRLWKLNRGENYFPDDDGQFSVPVAQPQAHHSPRQQVERSE